jgi:hypothetical protein
MIRASRFTLTSWALRFELLRLNIGSARAGVAEHLLQVREQQFAGISIVPDSDSLGRVMLNTRAAAREPFA